MPDKFLKRVWALVSNENAEFSADDVALRYEAKYNEPIPSSPRSIVKMLGKVPGLATMPQGTFTRSKWIELGDLNSEVLSIARGLRSPQKAFEEKALDTAFQNVHGFSIPFTNYGFISLDRFLGQVPGVVRITSKSYYAAPSTDNSELAQVYRELHAIAVEKIGDVPFSGQNLLVEYAKRNGETKLPEKHGFQFWAAFLKHAPGIHCSRHGDVLAIEDLLADDLSQSFSGNNEEPPVSKESLMEELLSLLPALPRLLQLPEIISAYREKYGKSIAFKAAGCSTLVDLLLQIAEIRRRLILGILPTPTHRNTFQILREIGEPFSHQDFVEAYVANFGRIAPSYEDEIQLMDLIFTFPSLEKNSEGLYAFTGTGNMTGKKRMLSKSQMERQKKKARKELGNVERRKRAAAEGVSSDEHSPPKAPRIGGNEAAMDENKATVSLNDERKEEIPGYGYVEEPLGPRHQ